MLHSSNVDILGHKSKYQASLDASTCFQDCSNDDKQFYKAKCLAEKLTTNFFVILIIYTDCCIG